MIHPFTVFVYVVYFSCRGKGVFYWLTLLLLFYFFYLQVCIFTCREIEVFIFGLEIKSLRNYTGQGQTYALLGLENIIYDNNNKKIEVGD